MLFRMTTYGSNIKKDPRPVFDKDFKDSSLRQLIEVSCYLRACDNKLVSIYTGILINIWDSFLLKQASEFQNREEMIP